MWTSLVVLAYASARLAAPCDTTAPAGLYEGTAMSQQAGKLDVTLNLRCADGTLGGALLTPVGNFGLRRVDSSTGALTIQFDANGDIGVIHAARAGKEITGSFALAGDSGTIVLHRVSSARVRDVPSATLDVGTAQWRADVDYFAREIVVRHASAFTHYPRAQFDADVAALKAALDTLSPDQAYVRLDAIANRIGDGHTFVALPDSHPSFPIFFRQFGAEYRATAAAPEYSRALGAQLVAVNGHPVAEVRARLLTLTPYAETMALRELRAADFLRVGDMLHGLGITSSAGAVSYTFRKDDGSVFNVAVSALTPKDEDRVDWRYVFSSQPLFRQHPGEPFWFLYLPDARTVYCNWRAYDSLPERGARLMALIDSVKPTKVVIDMRQNGGGDFNLGLKYIIEPLASRASVNAPGHLFVAIGTSTFSAGMANAAQFRTRSHATLVGDAIGERPNSYQEAREMRLPNSWLMVRYSTQYYEFAPNGPNEILPDISIPTPWEAYKVGIDPVMQRLLAVQ
jgi:hypothetical protein